MGIKVTNMVDSVLVEETKAGQGSHIAVSRVPIDVGSPVKRQPERWTIELSHYLCAAILRQVREIPEVLAELKRQDAGG